MDPEEIKTALIHIYSEHLNTSKYHSLAYAHLEKFL